MILVQLPAAELEVREAVDFYERQRPGLGIDFSDEVQRAYEVVLTNPQRWPLDTARVRRYRLRRFPYHVVYEATAKQVLVIAVAHAHRKPRYWEHRVR